MDQRLEKARQAFVRGVEQFELEQYESADAQFSEALELAPGRASVLMNLGITKVHLRQFAQAVPLLEGAVSTDSTLGDAWVALGLAQMELGHWDAALHSHERGLAQGMDSPPIRMRLGQCPQRAIAF